MLEELICSGTLCLCGNNRGKETRWECSPDRLHGDTAGEHVRWVLVVFIDSD